MARCERTSDLSRGDAPWLNRIAAILVFCLLSTRRHLAALASITTVVAVILALRVYGAAQDGTYAESAHLLIPETVMLVASLLGVLMERRRRALAVKQG